MIQFIVVIYVMHVVNRVLLVNGYVASASANANSLVPAYLVCCISPFQPDLLFFVQCCITLMMGFNFHEGSIEKTFIHMRW